MLLINQIVSSFSLLTQTNARHPIFAYADILWEFSLDTTQGNMLQIVNLIERRGLVYQNKIPLESTDFLTRA